MSAQRIELVRLGLRARGASTRPRPRWDRSPATCETVVAALTLEDQVVHCRYSNHGFYMLLPLGPTFGADSPREWSCAYPGPGDLWFRDAEGESMYIAAA